MREYLRELLVCPACRGSLVWTVRSEDPLRRGDVLDADALCQACGAVYPVKDGIGAFLTPDLYREDLWEAMESRLSKFLKANPEIDERLTRSPLEDLSGADKYFRGVVLAERRDYRGAEEAYAAAGPEIYTAEYLDGARSQADYVVNRIAETSGPVVDLATGAGDLARAMLKRLPGRPIVVTDFSPRILRSDKAWLSHLGLTEQVDYLAFDARKTPFRDGSVETLTTHAGLQNIGDGASALKEVRRVLKGRMFATCSFSAEDDPETREVLRKYGLEKMSYRESAVETVLSLGLRASVENAKRVRALPTPTSVLIEGAGIDAIPIKETVLEWCTLVITS